MFFAKPIGPPPRGFREIVDEVSVMVDELSSSELLDLYTKESLRSIQIERVGPGRVAVYYDDLFGSVKRGYIAPSMFNSYRSCARRLVIEIMDVIENGRVFMDIESLGRVIKGLLIHREYYKRLASGSTEVQVVSSKERIYGVIDELRSIGGGLEIVEIKTGFNPDLVGAGLQVMSYMAAASDQMGVPLENISGYVVTPVRTYSISFDHRVYREYKKRLEKMIEIALSKNTEMLPPRLRGDLERRCAECNYRGICLNLPEKYRSYDKYFEVLGFEKLVRASATRKLTDYV